MPIYQEVNCVQKGTKGIHPQTFVTNEAYNALKNSNLMDLWFLNNSLQDCQNALIEQKSNTSRNLCEKYYEICNLLLEYVNFFTQQKSYKEKLLNTVDRILKYLEEDFENNNAPALKDVVKFLYYLLSALSKYFADCNDFSKKLDSVCSLAMNYNVLTEKDFLSLKLEMNTRFKNQSFQHITFHNPVTELCE